MSSPLEISMVPDKPILGISEGESIRIGVSVLDESGQAVGDMEVKCIEENDSFSVSSKIQTTDNQGKAFFDVTASKVGCGSIKFSVNETAECRVIGVANRKEVEIGSIIIEKSSTPPCCSKIDIPIKVFDSHGQPLEGVHVGAVNNLDEYPIDSCQVTDTNGSATFYMYDVFWDWDLSHNDYYPIVATFVAGNNIATTAVYPIICEIWPDPDKESLLLKVGEEDTLTIRTQTPCEGDVDAEICLGYDSEFISVRPSRCQNSGSDAKATFTILGLKPGVTYITMEYGLAWDIDVTIEPINKAYANGKVTNSSTMEEIKGATIELNRFSADTREDGSYSIELQSGLNSLIASKENYYKTSWTGQSKLGEVITIDFPLNPLPSPDEPALSTATFAGEVKDVKTGESIKGDDWLFLLLPNGLLINDVSEGTFQEEGLAPGFYLAFLFKWGYLPWLFLFELEEGEIEMFTIELFPII